MSTTTKIVTGVDYVGIPSNDIETARAFYETVLGLEASSVWQRPGEEAVGAEFETGTVTIALINCPGLGIPFTTSPPPVPSSSHAASSSSWTRSTPACATWPTSRTPTATRSCCTSATRPRASGRKVTARMPVTSVTTNPRTEVSVRIMGATFSRRAHGRNRDRTLSFQGVVVLNVNVSVFE